MELDTSLSLLSLEEVQISPSSIVFSNENVTHQLNIGPSLQLVLKDTNVEPVEQLIYEIDHLNMKSDIRIYPDFVELLISKLLSALPSYYLYQLNFPYVNAAMKEFIIQCIGNSFTEFRSIIIPIFQRYVSQRYEDSGSCYLISMSEVDVYLNTYKTSYYPDSVAMLEFYFHQCLKKLIEHILPCRDFDFEERLFTHFRDGLADILNSRGRNENAFSANETIWDYISYSIMY